MKQIPSVKKGTGHTDVQTRRDDNNTTTNPKRQTQTTTHEARKKEKKPADLCVRVCVCVYARVLLPPNVYRELSTHNIHLYTLSFMGTGCVNCKL